MKKPILLLFSTILMNFLTTSASHMAGGEISYKSLGNNDYEVTLHYYRDCAGIPAPISLNLSVKSASCGLAFPVSMTLTGNANIISSACQSSQTYCNGGFVPAIEEYIYKSTVHFTINCSDIIFSISDCCRSQAVNTLNNPSAQNIYIEAFLNNLDGENSSPSFQSAPTFSLANGQINSLNFHAIDYEGDSLAYTLVSSLSAPSQSVNYITGYSATEPVRTANPLSVNANGSIIIQPEQQENGIIAVKVEEFRNGNLVGAITRDIQVNVSANSNHLPLISGINNSGSYDLSVCSGSQTTFELTATDADNQIIDFDFINSENAIAFSRNANVLQVTIDPADLSSDETSFSIKVSDNNCPMKGENTFTYTIHRTTAPSISVSRSGSALCSNSQEGYIYLNVLGNENTSIVWSNGMTGPIAGGLTPGIYTAVATNLSGCTSTISVPVGFMYVAPNVTLPAQTASCKGSTVMLDPADGYSEYLWSDGSIYPVLTVTEPGTYGVIVTDENGCTATKETEVEFYDCYTQMTSETALSVYPNPASENIIIQYNTNSDNIILINIMDAAGKIVLKSSDKGSFDHNLNINNLPSGIYNIQLIDSNVVLNRKFIRI